MTDDLATAPAPAGLGPALRPLAASYLVTYAGDGIFYVCAALYFTRIVGLSPIVYGAVLTGSWLLAMPLGVPVGHLADRFDARTVSMVMIVLSGLSVAVYVVVSGVAVFAVAACVLAICTQGTYSARSAMVGRIFAADRRTRVRAALVAVSNAGLALGAGLGALVIADDTPTGFRFAFAGDAASFLLAALLLLAVPGTGARAVARTVAQAPSGSADEPSPSALGVFRDSGYVVVSALNALLTLHVPLIDVALPLWIVGHTSAPAWSVAAVFVVNTALVVLLQYRTAKRIDGVDAAVRSLRIAGLLLFAGMALYALSGTPRAPWLACVVLLAAVAMLTFGEMRQTTSMTEISFRLVPSGRYGQYQGFFGMGTTLSEAVGPLLLTWLVLSNGPWGWLTLGVLFLLASFGMRFGVELARRTPLLRENVA
ncbi:MAG TPA: MFS transporter [Pseudonocardiaceae bacterium]|jgi:MFS family permease|nr:MFS transporter [Pseudonocardiaceae bacterium]